MTAKELIIAAAGECRQDSGVERVKSQMLVYLNESIDEFMRQRDWEKLKKVLEFTTDGSDEYTISDLVDPDVPKNILSLSDGENPYFDLDYKNYVLETSTEQKFSVLNDTLYLTGTGQTIYMEYTTPGEDYPMADDADENLVTVNYPDILKASMVFKFKNWVGDPTMQTSFDLMTKLIREAKADEYRAKQSRKYKMIKRS